MELEEINEENQIEETTKDENIEVVKEKVDEYWNSYVAEVVVNNVKDDDSELL
jgi:hypothetical protein